MCEAEVTRLMEELSSRITLGNGSARGNVGSRAHYAFTVLAGSWVVVAYVRRRRKSTIEIDAQ